MAKRLQLALVLLVLAAVTVLIISAVHLNREPVYQGRALSSWLQTYDPSSPYGRGSPQWTETDKAVQQMGTNSIPFLLQMLRAKDSELKLAVMALARRQKLVRIHFAPASARNLEASRAFIALGDTAKGAVPGLMRIYAKRNSAESMSAVAEALGWIGPAANRAIPLLLQAATNSNERVKASSLWAMGEIRAEPQFCLPVLVRGLSDTNAWTQISAAHALGMFGADAQAAVPALTLLASAPGSGRLLTTRLQVQMEARKALHKINPDPPAPSRQPDFDLGMPAAGSLFPAP